MRFNCCKNMSAGVRFSQTAQWTECVAFCGDDLGDHDDGLGDHDDGLGEDDDDEQVCCGSLL